MAITYIKLGEFYRLFPSRLFGLKVVIDSLFDDSYGMVLLKVQIGSKLIINVIADVVGRITGYDIFTFGC